jgi:hypothetical protein
MLQFLQPSFFARYSPRITLPLTFDPICVSLKEKEKWNGTMFFLVVLNGRGATHLDYRREESLSRESLAKARYRWNSKETGICQEGRE